MGLKGKIFKFMGDILKDGSYYKLYTQAKSTSACGLPKGFFFMANGTIFLKPGSVVQLVRTSCGLSWAQSHCNKK